MDKLCLGLSRCLMIVFVVCFSRSIALGDSITRTFSFSGSGFCSSTYECGPQGPVDPVFGELTITFDPTVTVFSDVDSFTSNLDVTRPVTFLFRPGQNSGELGVGTACNPNFCSAASGSDDVLLDIYGAATSTPSFSLFAYSTTTGGVFEASDTTLSFADAPEPSSSFLLCAGVCGLAVFGLRSRTSRSPSERCVRPSLEKA